MMSSSAFRRVCSVADVPEGEARMFVVEDLRLAVFHMETGFHVLDAECPHAGASLAHGIIEDCTVRCRIHHWRFDIRDGTYVDEDKPQFNARSFEVRVSGDDVMVEL